jgi:hypothetical protein
MSEFTMSIFKNKDELYAAKAQYFERLAIVALKRLEELEEVMQDDDGEWISRNTGEYVIEGL